MGLLTAAGKAHHCPDLWNCNLISTTLNQAINMASNPATSSLVLLCQPSSPGLYFPPYPTSNLTVSPVGPRRFCDSQLIKKIGTKGQKLPQRPASNLKTHLSHLPLFTVKSPFYFQHVISLSVLYSLFPTFSRTLLYWYFPLFPALTTLLHSAGCLTLTFKHPQISSHFKKKNKK